jgi:hypothetical protein
MGSVTFRWSAKETSSQFNLKIEDDIIFKPGRINLVVGGYKSESLSDSC